MELDDKHRHVMRRRKEHATYVEIGRELGMRPQTVSNYAKRLHKAGLLSEEHAYRWHKKNPRVCHRAGKVGPRIPDLLTLEEAGRLDREVRRGGYEGYNELLVELFRDWVAEKDAGRG